MAEIGLLVLHSALLKHPSIRRLPRGCRSAPRRDGEVERCEMTARQMIAQVTGR